MNVEKEIERLSKSEDSGIGGSKFKPNELSKTRAIITIIDEVSVMRDNSKGLDMQGYLECMIDFSFNRCYAEHIAGTAQEHLIMIQERLLRFMVAYHPTATKVQHALDKEVIAMEEVVIKDESLFWITYIRGCTDLTFGTFPGQRIGELLGKIEAYAKFNNIPLDKLRDLYQKYYNK